MVQSVLSRYHGYRELKSRPFRFTLWNRKKASEKLCYCISIQGLHPSKDPAFVVFEGKSFGETLLTVSAVKWDGRDFNVFPGLRHIMFYPYVTISAAQAHESDDLRHAMSPLYLFLLIRATRESWDMWGHEG